MMHQVTDIEVPFSIMRDVSLSEDDFYRSVPRAESMEGGRATRAGFALAKARLVDVHLRKVHGHPNANFAAA